MVTGAGRVSAPDPDLGEEVEACVVLRAGGATAEELRGYLRDRIAPFEVPRCWELRAALPHTASERVAEHALEAGRGSFPESTAEPRPRA